jgi:hypothetical protein
MGSDRHHIKAIEEGYWRLKSNGRLCTRDVIKKTGNESCKIPYDKPFNTSDASKLVSFITRQPCMRRILDRRLISRESCFDLIAFCHVQRR